MSERFRSLFGKVFAISIIVSLSNAAVAQISFVQVKSATATSGSSIAVAYTNAQTAGNLNVVAVMWGDTTSTVSSVTDSRGNTYALAVGPTRITGLSSSIYYAKNIAAGSNTVTVTFNQTAGFPNVNVLEYSGLSTTSPLDVTAGATGSGTTANSGSATTTSANELIVGMGNPTGSGFTAAGSGFTSRIINSFGGISEDKIVTSTGSYNATATLNSGTWVMQMAAFRASGGNPAPTVTAISPPSGTTAGGTPVTISGTGFLAGATVSLGGTAATGVTVVSSSSITATTPAHAAGAVNVVVTNTDTQSGTLTNGYTYTTTGGGISFVQVKSATATSGSSIAVAYTNAQTASNLNVVAVMWGDTTSTVSSVTDSRGNTYALAVGPTRITGLSSSIYYAKNIAAGSNTVTVTFNQTAGFPNVNVLEYSGLSTTSPLDVTAGATGSGTTANSGSATTTSANELIVGMGNPTGSGFTAAGSGFTSRIINSFGGISEDKIVTSTGSYNATATLNSGTWVMQMAAFRASGGNPAPTVTAISPPSGTTAGGTPVTISGTGFLAGATVSLGGTAATGVTVVSSSSITATTPAHAAGAVNVVVTNTDTQSGTLTNGYTFSSGTATVTGMTPNQGAVGVEVTIAGTNLGASGSVTFNGLSATPWSWSPTLITVPVPLGATSGNVVVTVSGVPLTAGSFTVLSQVPSSATEFSYDSMGRVSQALICTPMNCGTGGGVAMLYTYDRAGDSTSISSYGGVTQQYILDGAGRVSQVTSSWADAQHPATLATVDPSVGYSPTGALRKMVVANNLTETAVYNSRLQPCRINVNSSGTLLSNCSDALPSGNFQDYNAAFSAGSNNGNVGGVTASGQQQFSRTYGYDSLNRLQSMSAPGDGCSGLSWTYDGWGNRTAQNVTGGTCFSSSNAGNTRNQLIGAPYQYDAAGNLLNDGSHTYTYDAENRITTVDGGATATYVYDAFGKRVGRTVSGRDDEYIYDNEGQINSVLGNGLLERMYLYMNGQPLAEYFESTTYFVHSDHLGSTRLLTRLDQTVRESDDYYPFGEQVSPTGGTAGTLKFTGKERDSESGLDNFGARYHASSLGRFMTPDWSAKPQGVPYAVLGDPQSLNLYSYVGNNPTTLRDPDGHVCSTDVSTGNISCIVDDRPSDDPNITHSNASAQNTCKYDACVTAQAPNSIWGRIGGWFGGVAVGIVRWGKLGGPEHRAGIARVAKSLKESGFEVEKEVRVPTPNGAKSSRWVDVVGNRNGETRMYQIGRQNLDGSPVAREVQALDDIEGATGIRPTFLPYNVGEPNFGVPGATDMAPGVTPGEGEIPVEPEIIPE